MSIINTANFNACASWDGLIGNVTTVGSNGGPSYYGTYDHSGQIGEWLELNGLVRTSLGYFSGSIFDISKNAPYANTNNLSRGKNIGFRISTINNNLNLNYFIDVNDSGNQADTNGFGSVAYDFKIRQYHITNCEYVEFLNAIAKIDNNLIYESMFNYINQLGVAATHYIIRTGSPGSYVYTTRENYDNKPVFFVNWFDCARYCNWLHNNKPIGLQNESTTEDGVYNIQSILLGQNLYTKKEESQYWISTVNERHKSAFYTGSGGYWMYATQSNDAPICIQANSNGDGPVSSNYTCYSTPPNTTATPTPTVTPTTTPTSTPTPSITSAISNNTNSILKESSNIIYHKSCICSESTVPIVTATPTLTITPTLTTTPTLTASPTVTATSNITPTPTPTNDGPPEEPPKEPCLDIIELADNNENIISASTIDLDSIGGLDSCGDGDGGGGDGGGGDGGGGGGGDGGGGGGGGGEGGGGEPPEPPQVFCGALQGNNDNNNDNNNPVVDCDEVVGHPPTVALDKNRPSLIINSDFNDAKWIPFLSEAPINPGVQASCSSYWRQFDKVLKNRAIERWLINPFYIGANGAEIPVGQHPNYKRKECWDPNPIKKFDRRFVYKCAGKCYYDFWYECRPKVIQFGNKKVFKRYISPGPNTQQDQYGNYIKYTHEGCKDEPPPPEPEPPVVEPPLPPIAECDCDCDIECNINNKTEYEIFCDIKIQQLNTSEWINIGTPSDFGSMSYQPNWECSEENRSFPLCWINSDKKSETDYIFQSFSTGSYRLVSTKTIYKPEDCEYIKEIFICQPKEGSESIIQYIKQSWKIITLTCLAIQNDGQWRASAVLNYLYMIAPASSFTNSSQEIVDIDTVINSSPQATEQFSLPSKYEFSYTFDNLIVTKTEDNCPKDVRMPNPDDWLNFPIKEPVCRPLPPGFNYTKNCLTPTPTPPEPTPTPPEPTPPEESPPEESPPEESPPEESPPEESPPEESPPEESPPEESPPEESPPEPSSSEDFGCCCVYEQVGTDWVFSTSFDTNEAGCVAEENQSVVFRPNVNCNDDPDPCVGDPSGTCCDGEGGCLEGGPGPECFPSNDPAECFCDSACYTGCFDCCGADAPDCCTPSPVINSLWQDPGVPDLIRINIEDLERDMSTYNIDINEAWGAAMQSGSTKDGYYLTQNYGRISLIICLQEIANNITPWIAIMNHQLRVRKVATEIRNRYI